MQVNDPRGCSEKFTRIIINMEITDIPGWTVDSIHAVIGFLFVLKFKQKPMEKLHLLIKFFHHQKPSQQKVSLRAGSS